MSSWKATKAGAEPRYLDCGACAAALARLPGVTVELAEDAEPTERCRA